MQVIEEGLSEALLEGLSCPISFQIMTDPVMADDGHTYQRHAIEGWINKCTAGEVPAMGGEAWLVLYLYLLKGSYKAFLVCHNVYVADKRPLTSPLTGAAMGAGFKSNLHARSMVANLVHSSTQET
jgi:hypothetical protein